jgi:hypothetical protein
MATKSGLNQADWREIKAELRHILIGVAKLGKTIFYSDLAKQVTYATIHHRAPAFDHILQELCADEVGENRPILGVVVVNKATGRCGDGFYKWASAYGYDTHNPQAFWDAEFNRVLEYWQNAD